MEEERQQKPLRQRLRVPLPEEYSGQIVDSQAILRDRRDWQLTKWTAFDKLILWGVILLAIYFIVG